MNTTRWVAVAAAFAAGAAAVVACGSEPRSVFQNPGDAGSDAGSNPGDATIPDSGGDDASPVVFVMPEAGADGGRACTPLTACPSGVQCGRYVDPCTGTVLACGSPCASGSVCVMTSADPPAQTCQPKSCVGRCGVIGVDSCGVAIGCNGCAAGQDCVHEQCVPHTTSADAGPSDACAPLTCAPSAGVALCGTIHDNCGHSEQCSCAAGDQCVAGVCQAPAPECGGAGNEKCGTVANACGSGSVSCGSCSGASKCVGGTCTPCTAPVCGAVACGSVSNGCGPAVSCGTCATSEVCDDGGCCTPMTCAAALDAGRVSGCGPVDLGCGVVKACQSCATGQVCANNTCQACAKKTCGDYGNAGCGHSDGCGGSLNCCAEGTTCQGSICCAPGEVNYNGSCCLPACDPAQPPGTQISCGQVIYCAGGGGGSSGGAQ